LEKPGEDDKVRSGSKTLITLLRYSAADTPLLLVAFSAGTQEPPMAVTIACLDVAVVWSSKNCT
jgi:hypothetical protein